MASKVYFTKTISPEAVVLLYEKLGISLQGSVAVKVHSGEKGNQNFLRPEFWKPMVDKVGGTVVECNTAYGGARCTTKKHRILLREHKWEETFRTVIMDAEGPDLELEIPNGKVIRKNRVGKGIADFDSMLVLSHFKGHVAGGYGGALKQLSIGCASSAGKTRIHTAGVSDDPGEFFKIQPVQDRFLEAMADAAWSVTHRFEGKLAFINVMKNLSIDCDCDGNAEKPCMQDIGILASLDPVAIDQACMDLVYAAKDDPGQKHFLERVESRHGIHTIEAAADLGIGSREYELIEI